MNSTKIRPGLSLLDSNTACGGAEPRIQPPQASLNQQQAEAHRAVAPAYVAKQDKHPRGTSGRLTQALNDVNKQRGERAAEAENNIKAPTDERDALRAQAGTPLPLRRGTRTPHAGGILFP